MNAKIKLSSKGQVVIPKSVRDAHGWKEGTELELVDEGKAGVTLRERTNIEDRFPKITMKEFLERRVRIDRPLPGDREIDEILLAEAARRFDATRR